MIKNEETYCVVYHKIVRELGAMEAVIYSTIVSLLRRSDGIGEVSNQTIMDMCGINNKMSLNRYLNKLIETGYIEKREGKGRGNISIYYITKKGNNLLPIKSEKGNKNDTEKVTKMSEKGNNLLPINKGENKEINKESGGDMRTGAQSPTLSDTTQQKIDNMEDFKEWWDLFTGGTEFQSERENCERVWYSLQQNWRDNLVQMAKNGMRWRRRENDNPYWYLKNYNGETVKSELPYLRQGTAAFEKWRSSNEAAGIRMCLLHFEERVAYCLHSDLQTMLNAGARLLNDNWK